MVERNNWGVCGCLLLVPWLQAFYSLSARAGTPGPPAPRPPHTQIVLQDGTALSAATAEEEKLSVEQVPAPAPSTQMTKPTHVGILLEYSQHLPERDQAVFLMRRAGCLALYLSASRDFHPLTITKFPRCGVPADVSADPCALRCFDIFIISFPGWMYANPEQR